MYIIDLPSSRSFNVLSLLDYYTYTILSADVETLHSTVCTLSFGGYSSFLWGSILKKKQFKLLLQAKTLRLRDREFLNLESPQGEPLKELLHLDTR